MANDYYDLFELKPEASFDEIHKAYRVLAMRHHPDRNSRPDAASTMAALNEAYSVLSDPSRRRLYDRERSKPASLDIGATVLSAAREALMNRGWVVDENDESHLVLQQGLRSVRITFVARLENAMLRKIGRQFAGFSVVLALDIETPINLSFHTAVIDLLHSRHHGAPFPDDVYRSLFAAFLRT